MVSSALGGGSTARADAIDWEFAARVASRVAGRDPLTSSYLAASLRDDFTELTAVAEGLVGEFTGLRSATGPATAHVLDRREWVDANLVSFRRMLAPLTAKARERMMVGPLAGVGRRVTGAEMGMLLGFFSQRVLGQYDLLLAEGETEDADGSGGSDDPDAIYYVGANIMAIEKRFDFRPRDFRMWIALHEVTHRAQFTGVPWLKQHVRSLMDRSLAMAEVDPKRLVWVLQRMIEELRRGRNPIGDAGLIGLFATPEQQVILDEMQAVMSLLEGHGNFVMDELGKEHVVGQERMSRTLAARRHPGGLARQIQRLAGLEMKLRQYEVGERFIQGVRAAAGVGALDAAWRGPEFLPTLAELELPEEWLARVDAVRVSGA